jgi:predicted 3-demethylubiquinone-9 3-methyltransferase (glyoxalase superfamily)
MAKLMNDSDKARAGRVMDAMLKMKKLDIAELKRAAEG